MFLFVDSNWNQVKTKKLMVDDVEKYRMVISMPDDNKDKLVYGKGKILFDTNLINIKYGGAQKQIDYKSSLKDGKYWKELYGFFDDGYYTYNSKKDSWTKIASAEKGLGDVNPLESACANFLGWFTDKNQKIETLKDLENSLFTYRKNDTLPTITLYAHWEIKTFNVTFRATVNGFNTCAFWSRNKKKFIEDDCIASEVPYGTTLGEVETKWLGWQKKDIEKYYPRYYQYDLLDSLKWKSSFGITQKQCEYIEHYYNWIIKHAGDFWRGWTKQEDGNGKVLEESYVITKAIDLYPQFDALVYWESEPVYSERGEGGTGSWISHFAPGTKKQKVQNIGKKVPCFKFKKWPVYGWSYSQSGVFPLKSGQSVIISAKKIK